MLTDEGSEIASAGAAQIATALSPLVVSPSEADQRDLQRLLEAMVRTGPG